MIYKNVAIIGANGFIGKHLSDKLSRIPEINVFLFGRGTSGPAGHEKRYAQLDLSKQDDIAGHFSEIELVYYLASETIPSTSWDNAAIEIEKNLLPFIGFVSQAVKFSLKKIVFISSAGTIYGPSLEKVTEDSYTNPFSPYGINKLTMEHYLNYFRVKNGLQYDIFRVSNIYGEGQNTKKGIGIINTFLENILAHNKIEIFGDGAHVRNYIYIHDLISMITQSLYSEPSLSNTFNASSNDTLSINELVTVIKEVVAEEFEIIYLEKRQSDNSAIYLDNTKITGAYPTLKMTPIATGILKTYLHIRAQD
jgi:UDP-glucose 4-epimerase